LEVARKVGWKAELEVARKVDWKIFPPNFFEFFLSPQLIFLATLRKRSVAFLSSYTMFFNLE